MPAPSLRSSMRLRLTKNRSGWIVSPPSLQLTADVVDATETSLSHDSLPSPSGAAPSRHPCGASFNELLVRDHLPLGYDRYRQNTTYRHYGLSVLPKQHWLFSARAARARFCAARPADVASVCGKTCVVSLKVHLNEFVSREDDPDLRLLVAARSLC